MPGNWRRSEPTNASAIPPKPSVEKLSDGESKADSQQAAEWAEQFVPETAQRRLADLVVPATVRERIDGALSQIRHRRILFDDWNLKKIHPKGMRMTVNLYGEPGTGKSFCAEAIAHELGKPFIRIDYSELISKYVGETGKRIAGAFRKATEADAVLFFDEAETVLSARLKSPSQGSDKGVNDAVTVMLMQMDRFDGVLLFATNKFENYDTAFRRRILTHIHFELPDRECRVRLWSNLLPPELPRADDVQPDWLADQSDGLAGGDLLNVVLASAGHAVQRSGTERRIARSDLLNEINHIRTAKQHNTGNTSQSTTTSSLITRDELPDEATKSKYDDLTRNS